MLVVYIMAQHPAAETWSYFMQEESEMESYLLSLLF